MSDGPDEGAADRPDPAVVAAAIEQLDAAVTDRALDASERSFAEGEARIRELEGIVRNLCEEVVDRDEEIAALRAQIGEAGRFQADARGQATRIRMQALRFAARLGDGPQGVATEDAEPEAEAREADAASATPPAEPESDDRPELGAWPELTADPDRPVAKGAETSFARTAAAPPPRRGSRIEIGPLASFGELVEIEDALTGLDGVSEVRVIRFSTGRATFDCELASSVDLAGALAAASGRGVEPRPTDGDTIVLDIAESSTDAA